MAVAADVESRRTYVPKPQGAGAMAVAGASAAREQPGGETLAKTALPPAKVFGRSIRESKPAMRSSMETRLLQKTVFMQNDTTVLAGGGRGPRGSWDRQEFQPGGASRLFRRRAGANGDNLPDERIAWKAGPQKNRQPSAVKRIEERNCRTEKVGPGQKRRRAGGMTIDETKRCPPSYCGRSSRPCRRDRDGPLAPFAYWPKPKSPTTGKKGACCGRSSIHRGIHS